MAICLYEMGWSQVGINTTTPQAGSMLDIESSDKGMLVPRVNISDLSTIAPITGGATESLLVYNTNTTTGKGFYYWSGSQWVAASGDDWKEKGNSGTDPNVDFVGTTDNASLTFRTNNTQRFQLDTNGSLIAFSDGSAASPMLKWNGDADTGMYRSGNDEISFSTGGTERLSILSDGSIRANTAGTASSPLFGWSGDPDKGFFSPATDEFGIVTNGTERLRIPNAHQIHAMADGTTALPFYSWNSDPDTGLWHSNTDRLNLSAGGLEFIELNEGGTDQLLINEGAADIDTRITTQNETNALFVDGANDNMGLGTGTPNTSAQLEMADTDRGILINRVALTSTTSAGPVSSPATGLLVYNTATASSGSTEVLPGFYYWEGSRWVAMGGTGGKDWSLEGNAGTNASNNFIGTTDANDFVVRTDNTERIRVASAGTVGIGNTPYSNAGLRVNNAAQPFGIIAETAGDQTAIYGTDTGTGDGVTGYSLAAWGLFGQSDASNAVSGGAVLLGTATNDANGLWSLAGARPTLGTSQNIGVRAVSGSYTSVSPVGYPTIGMDANAIDLGMYALTEGPVTTYGDLQAGLFKTNYTGSNIDTDSRDPQASLAGYSTNSLAGAGTMYYGGYFYSGSSTPAYAYAGANFNGTLYKIIGNGTVSTIVDGAHKNDTKKVMFAPEAPEVLLEDYGTGKLAEGTAYISIDPILSQNILVDANHPLKVFIQLEGDCKGVYVSQKSAQGFLVKELQQGTSNVDFSWHLVANRKDSSSNEFGTGSRYADLRFPDAPSELIQTGGSSKIIEKETPKLSQIKPMK